MTGYEFKEMDVIELQPLKWFLEGYLRIQLSGYDSERFLNLCMKKQIVALNLSHENEVSRFFMTVKDFRRVRPLVRKTHVHLKIIGRYGLPFFLYRNRRRKGYVTGFTLFFLLLYIMSNFIWNISIEGNRRYTDDAILSYLSQHEIHYGMLKRKIDCDSLEQEIREDYSEIIWVSASITGTRLLIKIRENDVIAAVEKNEDQPCDLVSDKDGIITDMIVRSGKAEVKQGDVISMGQLLVSGTVPILGDSGELLRNHLVAADADITARTEMVYTEKLPKQIQERIKTGRIRYGAGLKVGPGYFLWMIPGSRKYCWQITRENRQVVLMKDFYLPIWVEWIKAEEYVSYDRNWTDSELEAQKNSINEREIDNLQKKGVQIIENDVRILDKSSHWEISSSFVLEEPVGIRQNINRNEEIE